MSCGARFYVYVHSRLKNGEPFYIGKGCRDRDRSFSRRPPAWERIVSADCGFHSSKIADHVDEDFAFLLEVEAIDKFRRLGAPLVNRSSGGEGAAGVTHTAASKAKFSAAKIGKKRGPYTAEHREKISISQRGKVTPPAVRAKISASTRLAMRSPQIIEKMRVAKLGIKRAPHSEETRLKMSAAATGKPKSAKARAAMSAAQRKRFNKAKE